MTKEKLLEIREIIEKILLKKSMDLDTIEIVLNIHQFLNPDMYEINKEVLNRELIKRQFERLPKR